MSLLRIYASPADVPGRYQWALIQNAQDIVKGESRLEDLPQGADRVHLILPAQQVLVTRTKLPPEARKRAGSSGPLLAFAIEDQMIGDPDANQVSRLGSVNESDMLAVIDKQMLQRWRGALEGIGIRNYEVQSEALLLPMSPNEWSMAWQGKEGFVRTGEMECTATDQGDRKTPPHMLRLLLEEAEEQGALPAAIALYTGKLGATPDAEAWQRHLGVPVRLAGPWNWRNSPLDAGVMLTQEQQGWKSFAGLLPKLRRPALILAGALVIHTCALVIDWALLAGQQRSLRQGMETQFRAVFPEAVAVVDPLLQMRRNLAEQRHNVGQPDEGDYLPMTEKVAAGLAILPPGSLRALSYESGRVTLELSAIDNAATQQVIERLRQSGLQVEQSVSAAQGAQAVTLMVRPS